MSTRVRVVTGSQPSYQVLKWIGGGGFGQVYKVLRNNKILACKQIRTTDPQLALAEHELMIAVKGGPYIASVHEDVEWNPDTKTLSFFMDYYRGKDLDRVVQMLQAAGERFTEAQVLDIACQIAMALEHCHGRNILHQDMKPMNVLLREPWDPLTEPIVPEVCVTDFGISSHVHTIGTRMTGQRGTPPYEAPEILGHGPYAEFSQKSDIYALGCILYRLCTLDEPNDAAGSKPRDISREYSIDILCLISQMLSYDRDDRPTASQVKQKLLELIRRYLEPGANECLKCRQLFHSAAELKQHIKENGHFQSNKVQNHSRAGHQHTREYNLPDPNKPLDEAPELQIRNMAKHIIEEEEEEEDSYCRLCAVCMRNFHSKNAFFGHLHNGHHWREPGFVFRRFAEHNVTIDTIVS